MAEAGTPRLSESEAREPLNSGELWGQALVWAWWCCVPACGAGLKPSQGAPGAGFSGDASRMGCLGLSKGLSRVAAASCRETRFFLGGGIGGCLVLQGGTGTSSAWLALVSVSWPCSVVLEGLSPRLLTVPWEGRLREAALEILGRSLSAVVPTFWLSRDTLSEMRRLGGAAGRVFFKGSGGGGAGCKGLGAVPGFISSSPKGPRPTAGRARLSQAVMGGWLGWPGGPGAWGAR